jgi:hypothetical protein
MGLIYSGESVATLSNLANQQANLFAVQNDGQKQKKIIRTAIIVGSGLFLILLLKVIKK